MNPAKEGRGAACKEKLQAASLHSCSQRGNFGGRDDQSATEKLSSEGKGNPVCDWHGECSASCSCPFLSCDLLSGVLFISKGVKVKHGQNNLKSRLLTA
ncbi:unnamed protein product [Urochloa humidicola]